MRSCGPVCGMPFTVFDTSTTASPFSTPSLKSSKNRIFIFPSSWAFGRKRLIEPARDHRGDLPVVLFQHHHVAVAADTQIGEPDERGVDSRLTQVFHRAVIVGRVVGRLGGEDQD